MSDPCVYLFVSTGRCGTQWLASTLDSVLGDAAVVTHEPIGPGYHPKRFFRQHDRLDEMRAYGGIPGHLDEIERTVERRAYVETGWSSYAAIPLFEERFGSRLRLIHLVRHPVLVAMSYVTLGFFDERDDEWAREVMLDPSCPGVLQRQYASRWPGLEPYEKCLFGWTEINLYGTSLRVHYPMTPILTVRMEDLLEPESGLADLFGFLGFPGADVGSEQLPSVDAYRFASPADVDWRKIYDHSRTVSLAEQLGYDVGAVDEGALIDRYRGPLPSWRDRSGSG